MKFRLVKIGTSWGITIPMGVAKLYLKDGFIDMEYTDEKATEVDVIRRARKGMKIAKRARRNMELGTYDFTLCDFHQICKGACGCK